MAEAEDVIVDAARHATAFVQDAWRRRRATNTAAQLELAEVGPRLALLLSAQFGGHWTLRVAQTPPPVTVLGRIFARWRRPWPTLALPCSASLGEPEDAAGCASTLWLPRTLSGLKLEPAILIFRAMALQQAMRARARPSNLAASLPETLQRDVYLVLEAQAADAALVRALPGVRAAVALLRSEALRRRPALNEFSPPRLPLEKWLRARHADADSSLSPGIDAMALIEQTRSIAASWPHPAGPPLLKDWWTGDWPTIADAPPTVGEDNVTDDDLAGAPVRSARLERRPRVRQPSEDEDDTDASPGAFMVQTTQPHEHAEDPLGAQRPADRDTDSAPEGHAESVSELAEARLLRTPQRAQEVLLSDDPPPISPKLAAKAAAAAGVAGIAYPEWDYRRQTYRLPGAIVRESPAVFGSPEWVERTLAAQHLMLARIRRQFEMLRAHRVTRHRQDEGDEIDIDACIEARSDLRAGAALTQRVYQQSRVARRDTAIVVLVDISGSTDGWLAGQRRIIDVEREALLPLSIALDSLGEPYAILAFSGEGPQNVTLRRVKDFDERHQQAVALRIAGLEPEHFTRAGAALRHAASLLVGQPAQHRLLLLLSDGKPNDRDEYEGRYGVEDMRQAVLEARQAGLSTFCLTVDRQAAAYLPRVFGTHHYALLQQPERLPAVLLDWMKRLLEH